LRSFFLFRIYFIRNVALLSLLLIQSCVISSSGQTPVTLAEASKNASMMLALASGAEPPLAGISRDAPMNVFEF
jgi:hypothetical protein